MPALAPILPGSTEPIDIGDVRVKFTWPDINDKLNLTVQAVPGAGQDLLDFVDFVTTDFLDGILDFSNQLNVSVNGMDLFTADFPLLGKGLDDILGGIPQPISFSAADVLAVSSIFTADGFKKFDVSLEVGSLRAMGLKEGNLVKYRGAGGERFDGQIDEVLGGGFTVRFPSAATQDPNAGDPDFDVFVDGTLGGRIEAMLGDVVTLSARAPTLQELVSELALLLGVDLEEMGIEFVG